jgi:NADH dehydrogenase
MQSVTLLGGTGFVGRSLAHHLAATGVRVRILTRLSVRAQPLLPLPTIDVVEANPHDLEALSRCLAGQDAVVNLIGALHDRPRGTFDRAHVELPKKVFAAARAAGVARVLHMSALGASDVGPSQYLKSRGRGEMVAQAAMADFAVTIFRPSVIFGAEDMLTNTFARMAAIAPFIPLAGAHTRFQPVHVEDVARAMALSLTHRDTIGQIYELGGPNILTLADIVRLSARAGGHARPVLPLGHALGYLQALALEMLPGPPLMTRDNLASMSVDNISSQPWPKVFGFTPTAMAPLVQQYLANATSRGRYGEFRSGAGR